jgi:hypothetical protein
MAIVQISQIQIRRGLQQDLPQLASAEMGWSLDTRRLFIGNGDLTEGAPTTGVTEILTEYSNFLGFISSYTFQGTDSGYTSQTGITALSPVTRSIQSVLDETISVRDFGATGNGTTDDTAAINRAIQQVYKSSLNGVHRNIQRIIKFPAGTYLVTGPILIPPNCTLVGEGKNNSVINSTVGTVLSTSDSLFQTGVSIGTNSALFPSYLTVTNMQFVTSATTTVPAVLIDSVTDVTFRGVLMSAGATATNVVTLSGTNATSLNVTFDDCVFNGGINGIGNTGTVTAVQVINSTFVNCSSKAINISAGMTGVSSINNYYNGIANPLGGFAGNNYSIGDTFSLGDYAGIHSGDYRIGTGRTISLNTGLNDNLTTLATGSGVINYQLSTASNTYRYGSLKYNNTGSAVSFDDEYSEPTISLGANLYANSTGVLSCTVTGSTTLKYSLTKFI